MTDMRSYLVTEFIEEYEDGLLGREDLQVRTHGLCTPRELAALLESRPSRAATRPVASPSARTGPSVPAPAAGDLTERIVSYSGPATSTLAGFYVQPAGGTALPAVLMVHENKGLTEHIKACARRLASVGYAVLAPDLLSRTGGTGQFDDPNDAVAAIGKLDADQNTEDLMAALDWLAAQPPFDAGRLGATGFCMGGGYAWRIATRAGNRLKAVVVWYGPNPPGGVEHIGAPVLGIYGELDKRITSGVEEITGQMDKNGKRFEPKVYPGAQHAFNNDAGERYHPEQAAIAWQDMLGFLSSHL
jgi:carboxymethylenebutenolidase